MVVALILAIFMLLVQPVNPFQGPLMPPPQAPQFNPFAVHNANPANQQGLGWNHGLFAELAVVPAQGAEVNGDDPDDNDMPGLIDDEEEIEEVEWVVEELMVPDTPELI